MREREREDSSLPSSHAICGALSLRITRNKCSASGHILEMLEQVGTSFILEYTDLDLEQLRDTEIEDKKRRGKRKEAPKSSL